MKQQEWETIKLCASMETLPTVPVALIVDSPWIPGYLGISTIDYLTIPAAWLHANLEIEKRFPEVIFLPGFWVEMGMAAEPSGFGCRVSFFEHKTPLVYPLFTDLSNIDRLIQPNPHQDGLMPWILNYYRHLEPQVQDAGHMIKVVAARGPLAVATHLMGVSDFLVGLKLDPSNTHKLLQITTTLAIEWLEAQAEVLSSIEAVMILDDIIGFLSPKDYLEFAHPYLKKIFDTFRGSVRFFHNDMDNPISYPYLEELGVQIFNLTHKINLNEARHHVGSKVCLMGNVAPLDVLCNGSALDVKTDAQECLNTHLEKPGLILSAGGGVSPGTSSENIRGLVNAVTGNQEGKES
jgi:uroporphyrinogen-III decarboxylase